MNTQVKDYVEKYPGEIVEMYGQLRQLILSSVSCAAEETVWAGMPSFYVGERFVRRIPFKNHINIEAQTAIYHKEELSGYKFTPKGMLQIFVNQTVPGEILTRIFSETLGR